MEILAESVRRPRRRLRRSQALPTLLLGLLPPRHFYRDDVEATSQYVAPMNSHCRRLHRRLADPGSNQPRVQCEFGPKQPRDRAILLGVLRRTDVGSGGTDSLRGSLHNDGLLFRSHKRLLPSGCGCRSWVPITRLLGAIVGLGATID